MKMILKVGRWIIGLFILLLAIAGMAEGDWLMAMIVAFGGFLVLPVKVFPAIKKQDEATKPTITKQVNKDKYVQVGDTKIIETGLVDLEVKMQVRQPTEDEHRVRELSKKATRLKKIDINAAVECLLEAKSIQEANGEQSLNARLIVFLQQAGRMKDAEGEFNRMLKITRDYHFKKDICDKMRLSLQREKRFEEAVVYGALSLANQAISRLSWRKYVEDDIKRVEEIITENTNRIWQESLNNHHARYKRREIEEASDLKLLTESAEENILKLLKKAKRTELLPDMVTELVSFINKLPNHDIRMFKKKIKSLLLTKV